MADPGLWLGQPVAVASKGPPRQISQQKDCGPRHRRQRRAELTACREMVLRERVPGGTRLRAVVLWAAADSLCEAHTPNSNCLSYRSNLASWFESSQVGRFFKRCGPPGGPAEKRMRELASMPAVQCSPNSTTRQAKGSVVCTTVTNTLVQNAISTLPARADGAAAGSGQQGRSSSEGRGAVVQDAEGSKQQPSRETTERAHSRRG